MPKDTVKSFAKKSGKSVREVEKAYKKAEKEAKMMGMGKNYAYIVSIWKNILNIKESKFDSKKIVELYLKSDSNFKDFLKEIESGSIKVSADIPTGLRPEISPEEEDEEEEKTKLKKEKNK